VCKELLLGSSMGIYSTLALAGFSYVVFEIKIETENSLFIIFLYFFIF
jgi:hypothetical protein